MSDDLDAVHADDALLNRLANGGPAQSSDEVTSLLAMFRASLDEGAAALAPFALPLSSDPHPRFATRRRAGALAAGVVLAFGGGGIAAATSNPGGTFYPLRSLLAHVVPAMRPTLADRAIERLNAVDTRIKRDRRLRGITPDERAVLDELLSSASTAVGRAESSGRGPLSTRLRELAQAATNLPDEHVQQPDHTSPSQPSRPSPHASNEPDTSNHDSGTTGNSTGGSAPAPGQQGSVGNQPEPQGSSGVQATTGSGTNQSGTANNNGTSSSGG